MTHRGHVKNGVVVFDSPAPFPEGMPVVISPDETLLDIEGQPIDPAYLIGDLAIDTGIPDLASNLNGGQSIASESDAIEDPNNPLLKMLELAVDTGIPDLATNIGYYLYGHPKVDDEE